MKKLIAQIIQLRISLVLLVIMTISCLPLLGQKNQQLANGSSKGGWAIKSPFKSEVFIENRGQFNSPDGRPLKNVKYAINNGGMKVYFTPSGLHYHVTNIQIKPQYKNESKEVFEEVEHSINKNGKPDESLKKYFVDKSSQVAMEWAGANADAIILVSEQVHDNYTYATKDESGNSIIAHAYKKLTYKNIYPNIDIEYYFPERDGKELGVEYNVVVHPGGDLSKVKMKYSGMQSVSMDKNGNIVATIPDGNITDHSPAFSFVGSENNQVQAKFILQDQTVSFNVPNYDKSKKLVIDPFTSVWSTAPGFATYNDGYTIRIDYNKNVYVMGGGINNGGFPFASWDYPVKKFDASGVLQWTAITTSGNMGTYGDMVVLPSGRVIVGHGFGAGNTGYIIATATGAVTTKAVTGVNEFGWRFSYNHILNNGTLWFGAGSNNGAHLAKTDTNLVAATLYNPWGGAGNTEDICYLAQDKAGANVYITNVSNSSPNSSTTAPKFCKSSTATPGTALWKVNEPTLMLEIGQGSFMHGGTPAFGRGTSTGMNGMLACDDRIYTCDGNNIRAYDAANGTIVNTATSGGTFDKYSGIDADDCCRLYVGVNGVVKRYTSALVFDQSITVTGDVYDLQLDPLDKTILYVTGKDFVQKLQMVGTDPPCGVKVTATGGAICSGTCASLGATGVSTAGAFTYVWQPGGLSGANPSVCPTTTTTYTVIATDGAAATASATAVVTVNPNPTVAVSPISICIGTSGTLTASGATTYTWSPSTGLSGTTGSTVTANPTITTTYIVTGTLSTGCTSSTTVVVTVLNPVPTADAGPDMYICPLKGDTVVTLTASGGNLYTWSDGQTTQSIVVRPTETTTYSVIVGNSCGNSTAAAQVVITVRCGVDIPNVITPNGDLDNQYFYINGLEGYPNSRIEIYDRWGLKMFESANYINDWDGGNQNTGKPVSDGVYYYILYLSDKDKTIYNGFVQVIRG